MPIVTIVDLTPCPVCKYWFLIMEKSRICPDCRTKDKNETPIDTTFSKKGIDSLRRMRETIFKIRI